MKHALCKYGMLGSKNDEKSLLVEWGTVVKHGIRSNNMLNYSVRMPYII